MPKQKVLLLGATGETGKSILEGLLENPLDFVRYLLLITASKANYAQQVDILVRPSSAAKPQVKAIAERGVSIRIADIAGPVDELAVQLEGVDILISAIDARSLLSQIDLATAAKKAGVKRFVPCNFASITPPGGVMLLRDLVSLSTYVDAAALTDSLLGCRRSKFFSMSTSYSSRSRSSTSAPGIRTVS